MPYAPTDFASNSSQSKLLLPLDFSPRLSNMVPSFTWPIEIWTLNKYITADTDEKSIDSLVLILERHESLICFHCRSLVPEGGVNASHPTEEASNCSCEKSACLI